MRDGTGAPNPPGPGGLPQPGHARTTGPARAGAKSAGKGQIWPVFCSQLQHQERAYIFFGSLILQSGVLEFVAERISDSNTHEHCFGSGGIRTRATNHPTLPNEGRIGTHAVSMDNGESRGSVLPPLNSYHTTGTKPGSIDQVATEWHVTLKVWRHLTYRSYRATNPFVTSYS